MPPTPDDLARRAAEVVAHLRQFEVWAPSMTGAIVDEHSDEVDDLAPAPGDPPTYRLFTFRRSARISGRLLLDPRDATVLEVRGVQNVSDELPPFVDPMEALRRHHVAPPPSAIPVGSWSLVWKYCAESSSRFTPFWRGTFDQQAWYVRVDGAIFSELTKMNR